MDADRDYFAGKNEQLIFEALNEETNFENEGSTPKAYATLTRVNQLFIDTVRKTGGNNAKRLLIVTGLHHRHRPRRRAPTTRYPRTPCPSAVDLRALLHALAVRGHDRGRELGKDEAHLGERERCRRAQSAVRCDAGFSKRNDIPAFIGEFGASEKKESASRVRWLSAVIEAALTRKMVPVLWDTGNDISRNPPYAPSAAWSEVMQKLAVRAMPAP